MYPIQLFFEGLWSVMFPKLCLLCRSVVSDSEREVCVVCRDQLTFTDFQTLEDNTITHLMTGRCQVEYATSLFYSSRSSLVRQLLYHLKYKGKQHLGVLFGEWLGEILQYTPIYGQIDLVLPIPIHPIRRRKRGYNQSEKFAESLSSYLRADYHSTLIRRTNYQISQVLKSQWNRWSKHQNNFEITNPSTLEGKHILLVDDLITTGNTIQSCIENIQEIPKTKISIATIAVAV